MSIAAITLDADEDPINVFVRWLLEAKVLDEDFYNVTAFATADSSGCPNVRMMLLKKVDESGLFFFSNEDSDKGREIAENPKAAFVLHLRQLKRQIRGRGGIERLSVEDADRYFATRPRESQIGAWVSAQSRPLPDQFTIERSFKKVAEQYFGKSVPRPPYWVGYRLLPLVIEFWLEKPYRLHERLRYSRERVEDLWETALLYP